MCECVHWFCLIKKADHFYRDREAFNWLYAIQYSLFLKMYTNNIFFPFALLLILLVCLSYSFDQISMETGSRFQITILWRIDFEHFDFRSPFKYSAFFSYIRLLKHIEFGAKMTMEVEKKMTQAFDKFLITQVRFYI